MISDKSWRHAGWDVLPIFVTPNLHFPGKVSQSIDYVENIRILINLPTNQYIKNLVKQTPPQQQPQTTKQTKEKKNKTKQNKTKQNQPNNNNKKQKTNKQTKGYRVGKTLSSDFVTGWCLVSISPKKLNWEVWYQKNQWMYM